MPVLKICQYCGKKFKIPDCFDKQGRGKYCSKKCYHSARIDNMPEFECPICGKIFKTHLNKNQQKYCSKECASISFKGEGNPMWNNGNHAWQKRKSASHAVWRAIRDGTIARGNCKVCGKENAEAHHHNYNKPLDVVWLCRKHHNEHHKNERRKRNGSND